MTIKEVEARTGLARSVVRFYEREGLIAPPRNAENGYRDYTPGDVALLERIAFLRTLDIPLDDVRRVIAGQAMLSDVARAQADALREKSGALSHAARLCDAIASDAPRSLDALDVRRYVGEPRAYAHAHRGALCRDCAGFVSGFSTDKCFWLLTALAGLAAVWAYGRLPARMPVQWSGGEVTGTAPRAMIFAYPAFCLALRFVLRGALSARLSALFGAYGGPLAAYAVNCGALMALSLEVFTVLYAHGLARSVVALLAGEAALLTALLAAGTAHYGAKI